MATWSIVGVDPRTNEVGVAVASCVRSRTTQLISGVSGLGVAVTQGLFDEANRHRATGLLDEGRSASEIVNDLAERADDGEIDLRQYGVVMLDDGNAASFTGGDLPGWAGGRPNGLFAVQGNSLASKRVVTDAVATLTERPDRPLADQLMVALATGSARGGDRRCNVHGIRQTAASAAILVLRPGDATYDGRLGLGDGEVFLELDAVDRDHRRNAVLELSRKYRAWREGVLPGAPPRIPKLPNGDQNAPPVVSQVSVSRRVAMLGVILAFILGLWLVWRDQLRGRRNRRPDEDPK